MSDYYRRSWDYRLYHLIASAKSREKLRKGHPVSVTVPDLMAQLEEQEYRCYFTGIPLTLETTDRMKTASIDRLDNLLGYSPGNVVIVTFWANHSKSNLSRDSFIENCRLVAKRAAKNAC